ncbi:hypothetical protein MVEN_01509500 [Mycena venus]|uniref:Uncharacterized protein n=1 Tax=Mycena venus TaxID=2733690 RepID=A0A8H7CTJ2_9AGAR|nr:hypothetical protein MVEN_01509500 [Mycena venus]
MNESFFLVVSGKAHPGTAYLLYGPKSRHESPPWCVHRSGPFDGILPLLVSALLLPWYTHPRGSQKSLGVSRSERQDQRRPHASIKTAGGPGSIL